MAVISGVEVVAPKVVGKVADQPEAVVVREMAVDGQVEQAIHLVEDVAMRHLAEGKSKLSAMTACGSCSHRPC